MDQDIIAKVVGQVLEAIERQAPLDGAVDGIPVGVSNRHIHLSAEHVGVLFGPGSSLTHQKDLKQIGEFAARETVTLIGPKGILRGVRVLGPVRNFTQIELARTDGFALGVSAPIRNSGDITGSAGLIVAGTRGAITLNEGVICAARHIHMEPEDAARWKVANGDRVSVRFGGSRGGSFDNVLIRVSPDFRLEFHIDTDEANAAALNNGDLVTIAK